MQIKHQIIKNRRIANNVKNWSQLFLYWSNSFYVAVENLVTCNGEKYELYNDILDYLAQSINV